MPAPSYSRFTELEAHARSNGLTADAAYRYAVIAWWIEHFGLRAPRIISGRRSASYQAELQRRWDSGDRAGLAVRPASRSAHTEGTAWDIESGPALDYFGALAPYLGVRWGGTFSTPDRNHFDLGAL